MREMSPGDMLENMEQKWPKSKEEAARQISAVVGKVDRLGGIKWSTPLNARIDWYVICLQILSKADRS